MVSQFLMPYIVMVRISCSLPLSRTCAGGFFLLPLSRGHLAGCAVIKTHDHGGIGDDDGIATLLGGNLEPAFDGLNRYRSIRKLFGDRSGVNRAWVRHADSDIDKHVVCRFAQHPKESEAGVADRVRDRALGRFGGIAPVNINARAHFSDTAHACHWFLLSFDPRDINVPR